jgi:hypothetical protein
MSRFVECFEPSGIRGDVGGRMKKLLIVPLVLVASLVFGAAPAHAASPSAIAGPAEQSVFSAASAAPSAVRGYTDHCRERMAERRVSTVDIEMTVLLYRSTAEYNTWAETWVYYNAGTNLNVVLNDSGWCVTVF